MTEIWKDIEGWEGKYQISNLGRVTNLNYWGKEKIMKCNLIKGYLRVHFYDKQTHRDAKLLVHRLVAMAFVPNPNNYPIINHKDENPSNCVYTNLEWCDYSYNARYGTAIKRRVEKQQKKVLQFSLDGKLLNTFNSITDAESTLGVFGTSISACCRGKKKTTGGYIWKYAS